MEGLSSVDLQHEQGRPPTSEAEEEPRAGDGVTGTEPRERAGAGLLGLKCTSRECARGCTGESWSRRWSRRPGVGAAAWSVDPGARAGAGAGAGAGARARASAARSWSPEQTLWRAAMDRMSDLRQLEEEREARDSG